MRVPNGLAVLAVAAAALALAGCGGGTSGLGGQPQSSELSGAGAQKQAFNPFNETPDSPAGPREVIKEPTLGQVMEPGPLPEMALGRADAPVTIIKYASLTCPYCRKFQSETFPELKRKYIDTGKVRFILREFPIGFQSGAATIALRCAPPERYFELYEKFLMQQGRWVSQEVRSEPIFQVAKQVGVSSEQYDSCRKNQSIIDGLKAVKERGRTLGIIGTPNFFVNGRLYKQVLTMSDLRGIIEAGTRGQTAAATGER